MAKTKKQKAFYRLAYKPLLASALAFAGVFNMMSAVLAEGTPAGTAIENTATATYSDGTNDFDAISNTVTINVAEVAGITVASAGSDDPNDGSVVTDDIITFDFEVTNTGNAPTFFYLPGPDQIAVTEGTIARVDIVTPSTPTTEAEAEDTTPRPAAPTVAAPAASRAEITGDGNTTDALLGTTDGLIAPDDSVIVRVTVRVDADAVGDIVTVQYGNTDDNAISPADDSQNQQNIPDATETGDATTDANNDDVRTVNEGAETPVNGEREAAASEVAPYATSIVNLAQALLLKTSVTSDPSATPANPTDDAIVYSLELQVGNQTFPGISPGNLEGTEIDLDGAPVERVLVSDAIPEGTTFDPAGTLTVPTGWTVVYSESAVDTVNALDAAWSVTQPADPATITRIGFIYDATVDGAIVPDSTVGPFEFSVITDQLPATGGNVANIAQVFGETENDDDNEIVFDESGDQNFNNLDDNIDPDDNVSNFDGTEDFGIGDINDPDVDRDNTGSGPDGESLVDSFRVPPDGELFNGPNGTPDAVGPNDTNDDFTNIATTLPEVGAPGTAVDPNPSPTITNELLNPASAPTDLDTVTLLPLSPSEADTATGTTGQYGADEDLPDGTQITISFGTQSVTYEYTAGNASPFHTVGDTSTVPNPVVVGTLEPGIPQDYEVTIDLPGDDPLDATDDFAVHLEGYGIPIAAFVDNDDDGAFSPDSELVANITINRVYTGFMELVKTAEVVYAERDGVTLPPTGPLDQAGLDLLTTDIRPGDEVVYTVEYENISEDTPVGSGNVTLTAEDFIITEDGNATVAGVAVGGSVTGDNNWASVTLHKAGATATRGVIEFFNGTSSLGTTEPADETEGPSAVTVYENNAGNIGPEDTGSMSFTREVQ